MNQSEWILRDKEVLGNLLSHLARLPLDKPWRISIKPYKRKRSLEQNSLYWEILTSMCNCTGHSTEEMHDMMRRMFLPLVVYEDLDGKTRETLTSTTSLSTADMSDYIERVRVFAIQEIGLHIPVLEHA